MSDEQQSFPAAGEIESKEYYSIDITPMERRPPSPDPVANGGSKDLLKQAFRSMKAKLRATREDNRDVGTNRSIFELTEMAASAFTTGFEVTTMNNNNNNSEPQDNNHNHIGNGVGSSTESSHVPQVEPIIMFTGVSPVHVTKALWIVALLTLIFDIGTALYKPARGVVFGRNKNAYYLTLGVIFVSGVIEAITAFSMSRTRDPHRRRFKFGSIVLCASIAPFVAIMAISGFAFTEG